jgi:hypothetical protein
LPQVSHPESRHSEQIENICSSRKLL